MSARLASLVIVNPTAGSARDTVRAKLERAFPRSPVVDFDASADYAKLVGPRGRLIVAGGDGTVGHVASALAGTGIALGIISLGTFNNFAKSLGLPTSLDEAIAAVKAGRRRGVTLGAVGDKVFLEAAAAGFFGKAIALGEAAKELEFGQLGRRLREVAGAREFEFTFRGDLNGSGRALSLVFANTPSTGAALHVATSPPTRPYLELSVQTAGAISGDLLGRAVAAVVGQPHEAPQISLHFTRLEIETRPRVAVYADNHKAGRTPVTITARPRALTVLLPTAGRGQ